MRTDAINQALERTISAARLGKYLDITSGDLSAALDLYERNTRLAEALYTTMQGLEICLRNTIDYEMRRAYGHGWFTSNAPPLQRHSLDVIRDVLSKLDNPTHDDVVAELKFSFWVGLLGRAYDNDLWRNALHRCFRATTGKPRRHVHGRMNALRRFRNRVAHHEPVFATAHQMHGEALEAIEWMCRDTYRWVASCSRFDDVYNS